MAHSPNPGCDSQWDDGRSYHLVWAADSPTWWADPWHRCTLPAIHDEPHQCGCGDTLTPAPLEV